MVRSAGSNIPTSPGLQSLDDGFFGKVDFLLFPGEEILYSYYEDDGITDYKTGSYNIFNLTMQEIKTNLHEKRKYKLAFSIEISCYSPEKERIFSFTLPDGFLFRKETLAFNGNSNIKTSFRGKSLIIKYHGIPDTFSVIFEGTYK